MKCIEDEIPFEVPEGWEWARLSFLAQYRKGPFGSSLTKAMFIPESPTAIKVYEQKNAINKDVTLGTYYISAEKYESMKSFEIFPNDIIVSCAGTIGETFVIPPNMRKGIINQALMKISLYDLGIMNFYLTYFDFVLKDMANEQGYGNALKNIPPFDVLKNYLIPLPPLQEQLLIQEKLSQVLSRVDTIDNKVNIVDKSIEQAKSKILDLAIRGKLVPQDPNDEPASVLLERIRAEKEELIKQGKIKRDKNESVIYKGDDNSYYEKMLDRSIRCIENEIDFSLPYGWQWIRLNQIGNWQAGATPSRGNPEYFNGNIPWLKTGDLNDGYISSIPEYISEVALKETSVKLNPAGSVLIAMYGATIGKLGVLTFPATTNQACCACQTNGSITELYLFYFLLSQRQNFIGRGVGGAQPNISKEKIVATLMALPPINEQKRIVSKITNAFSTLDSIEQCLN